MIKDADYYADIAKVQKATGCSRDDAAKLIDRQHILKGIENARDFYELRALLRTIAEKVL